MEEREVANIFICLCYIVAHYILSCAESSCSITGNTIAHTPLQNNIFNTSYLDTDRQEH